MPIYEYQCRACGHRTEALQRLSDPPLTVCPECGGELKRLISSPAFQFKGSGWYVTDYARAGKEKERQEGKGEKAGKTEKPSGETAADAAKPAAGGSTEAKAANKAASGSGSPSD